MLGEVWLDLGLGLCYGSRGGEGSPSAPPLLGEISNHPFLALRPPKICSEVAFLFLHFQPLQYTVYTVVDLGDPPP